MSVPYIFIYKDVNIFISALNGRSVGSIGNGIVFFFIALRSIAGWYIFSFVTVWFLNQYHSFVSFNHTYSDTWLSFQINIACFYHLRGILPWKSKSRNISFWVSHIKMTSWFWLFFCCIFSISCFFFRLRIRIWLRLLSEMPFAYIQFVNANPSQVYRPRGSVGNWVVAITCSAWTMCTGRWIHPKCRHFCICSWFDCPCIPSKVDLEKRFMFAYLNLNQTCELGIGKSCWVDCSSDSEVKTSLML